MVESVISRLRRGVVVPRDPGRVPAGELPARRVSLESGSWWPWLSLVFIVWLHPGWSADQIAELLAVFTPYIMLSTPVRR